ncbi:TonB-dependent receptor [Hymenobacter sp. 5516J-16]|uniref:TonB-dependent siderophore receptor n=1 Tax=Hymenobacter sp. 5516J-16 TaxID=2932253 RepID=UPI001FD36B4E|nr:TonB-dependent receptor [Hymenobacter sp. 5516J-16]UOQ79060.1 TonB-dependent receptor [Hymenobacter sp. 5516J-16]
MCYLRRPDPQLAAHRNQRKLFPGPTGPDRQVPHWLFGAHGAYRGRCGSVLDQHAGVFRSDFGYQLPGQRNSLRRHQHSEPQQGSGPAQGAHWGFYALVRNLSTQSNTRRAGFYVQDLLSLSEKVKVLAGLRWSYQETPSDLYYYNTAANRVGTNKFGPLAGQLVNNRRYDDAFSPRLGVVYQPIKTTALFASYSSSFTPQSNTAVDLEGKPLPPSIIDQYEVGIKNDLFKGALSANVTAYRIVNSNQIQSVLPTDPRFQTAQTTSPQELAGEVTSKGVEVDIQSKPMYGLSFIAGYSYNHTAYTNSNIFENGSRLRYNPAHTANLSLFYNFGSSFGENGFLRGLTAGVTTYYVGDKLAGRNPRTVNPADGKPWPTGTDANKFISIPNYLQFDASLGYSYDRFSVRVKMANLLNELSYNMHDDNSVNPIAPRNFSATLGYRL